MAPLAKRPEGRDRPPTAICPSILSSDFARLADECKRMMELGADWLHVDVMDGHFVPNLTLGAPIVKSLRAHTNAFLDVHLMVSRPSQWLGDFAAAGASMYTFHLEAAEAEAAEAAAAATSGAQAASEAGAATGEAAAAGEAPAAAAATTAAAVEADVPTAGAAAPAGVPAVHALVQAVKAAGMLCGMTIKPGTPVEQLLPYLDQLDMVLIMTVEPGFGGQSFMPDMMEKVRFLRSRHPDLYIEVDGGLAPDTIQAAADAGANAIVAGSAIFGAKDPEAVIRQLREAVDTAAAAGAAAAEAAQASGVLGCLQQ